MDDRRSVDVRGRRIVPNRFEIRLSPKDHGNFNDIDEILTIELAEAAREHAREEGYHFMGPVGVQLMIDNNLKPGRFEVVSTMREAGNGVSAGTLVMPSGERLNLIGQLVTVGRLAECSISLNDSNVSRRHAEVRSHGPNFLVVDLGSTNGTRVNGTRIVGQQQLQDGDIISFGGTHIRFEAS